MLSKNWKQAAKQRLLFPHSAIPSWASSRDLRRFHRLHVLWRGKI